MYYVYILSNWNHNVLYIGVTNDLKRRVLEHKQKKNVGFTEKYNVSKLLFYHSFSNVRDAIYVEKKLKGWKREKKLHLIRSLNPDFEDLSKKLF